MSEASLPPRNMSHSHEMFAVPDGPDVHLKLAAMRDPSGPAAKEIVLWVAEHLQLSALHPTQDRAKWPAPEGTGGADTDACIQVHFLFSYLPRAWPISLTAVRHSAQALRRKYGDLFNEADLAEDEIRLLNYTMLHSSPCSTYCLRDVKDAAGRVVGQRCRMRTELKQKNTCPCRRCICLGVVWV